MLVRAAGIRTEQLLATLLVFRVLYFVIPSTSAISIMGAPKFWLSVLMPWQKAPPDEREPLAFRRHRRAAPAKAAVPSGSA